jgi:monomeric sarcosine oxidase
MRRMGDTSGTRLQTVVIGAGLMGAASTLALARRGHAVVTLEARRLGHREGSSHGSSRIFRHSYAEEDYVAMTQRALGLWRDIEGLGGRRLLTVTGGLDYGAGRGVARISSAQRAAGVPCELLTAAEAARRWPHLRFAGDVLFTPGAGVIDPELAVAEMLRLARSMGAQVREQTPVLAVEPQTSGVRVVTAGETLCADVAVVAAGPWLPALLDGVLALPRLTVTRQQVFHFARREAGCDDWPVVLYEDGLSVFGLPGGRDGVAPGNMKVAQHDPGPSAVPGVGDGRIDEAGRARLVEHVRTWWPGLRPEPLAAFTCLYTMTADEDFVVDRAGPLVVCSPCSGHGAKFAPLIGEWAADLAGGGPAPSQRFALRRPGRVPSPARK